MNDEISFIEEEAATVESLMTEEISQLEAIADHFTEQQEMMMGGASWNYHS